MKILLAAVFSFFLTLPGWSQEEKKSDILLADFNYLVEKLEETHPDPYSGFGGKIEFNRKLVEYRKTVSKLTDKSEFLYCLNRFLAHIEDGHTFIYDDSVQNSNKNKLKLPIVLKASADGIFVLNTTPEYQAYKGLLITRINDHPVKSLLEKAGALLPAENISGSYYNLIKILKSPALSKKLLGDFESLDFSSEGRTLTLKFQENVVFKNSESALKDLNDNGLLSARMLGSRKDIGYFGWNSIIGREFLESTFKSRPHTLENSLKWAYAFSKKKRTGDVEKDISNIPALYETFYNVISGISEKKSNKLIIDLRNNSGGMTPMVYPLLYSLYGNRYLTHDFGAEMIRIISPLLLNKFGFQNIDDYNKALNNKLKHGDYVFDSFGNITSGVNIKVARMRLLYGYSGYGAEFLKKTAAISKFDFDIVVLTSPNTYSAAYHFVYFLKSLGNTTIVGVASRQAGNAFMEVTNLQLPNTGLMGSISNSRQILFPQDSPFTKLLKPDYQMNWDDYKTYGFDENAEVLKAIELLEKK